MTCTRSGIPGLAPGPGSRNPLVAKTGVGPQAGQSRGIKNLFAGLRTEHYLGLVWFHQHSYGGLYKGENWRLEDSPSALAAFHIALKG